MVVMSYGRNNNREDEIKKNQEKAKNSPSYRRAAIKQKLLFHAMKTSYPTTKY